MNCAQNATSPETKVVAVSGYFDPPTPAHLIYMDEAEKLGDKLIVILSRDDQLLQKRKGTRLEGRIRYIFEERKFLIEHLKPVDEVVENIDKDTGCAESLRFYQPQVFAKGGDRHPGNILQAEVDACKEIGCELVCGVGGEKTHSSSWYDWED